MAQVACSRALLHRTGGSTHRLGHDLRYHCQVYIGSISASPTACPLCGYGRAGAQNDRLGEAVILSTGTPTPAQWTCRRRCRDRADIEPSGSQARSPDLLHRLDRAFVDLEPRHVRQELVPTVHYGHPCNPATRAMRPPSRISSPGMCGRKSFPTKKHKNTPERGSCFFCGTPREHADGRAGRRPPADGGADGSE